MCLCFCCSFNYSIRYDLTGQKKLRLSVLVIIGYISIVKCNWISVWIYTLIIVIDATIIVCIVSSCSNEFVQTRGVQMSCLCVCVNGFFLQLFLSRRDGVCCMFVCLRIDIAHQRLKMMREKRDTEKNKYYTNDNNKKIARGEKEHLKHWHSPKQISTLC